jgi:hypothetical protein
MFLNQLFKVRQFEVFSRSGFFGELLRIEVGTLLLFFGAPLVFFIFEGPS